MYSLKEGPRMKSITFVAFLGAALTSAGFAQDPAETSPEKAAVIANDRLYEAAYANADVEALVNFFTEDAGYTTEEGRTFSGRAEIEAAIRAGLMANRGSKLAINAETVRVLGAGERAGERFDDRDGERRRDERLALHRHPREEGRQVEDRSAHRITAPGAHSARPARGARVARWRLGGDRQDRRPLHTQPVFVGARWEFSHPQRDGQSALAT